MTPTSGMILVLRRAHERAPAESLDRWRCERRGLIRMGRPTPAGQAVLDRFDGVRV
jgi:hypothetical protein